MNSDQRNTPADTQFRPVGTGHPVTRSCMGCGGHRITTGGTGAGIRWRCAACKKNRAMSAQTAE